MSAISKANRMVKHSSIYAIGNMSRQLVGFIMLPIYTRFLTPADYGVVGLLIFAISLIELLFGTRLGQAIPKFFYGEKSPVLQDTVVSTALIMTASISAITTIVIIIFRETSSEVIFGNTDYSLIVAIYSILVLTTAIENYGLIFIRIQEKPLLFLAFSIAKLALQLGLNVWLIIYKEMGVMGIAISASTSSIILSILLLIYTLYHTKLRWNLDIAKRLIIFSWPLWLAAFAFLSLGSGSRYFMRVFSTLDDIGLYQLALKFALIVPLLIWEPINQFWNNERFKYYDANKIAPNIYQSVFLAVGTILIMASLGISIFSSTVINIMSAPEFHDASKAVPILVLASLFNCFIGFMLFSFLVTDNTIWIAKNTYIIAALANILFLLIIPTYGFIGAAIAYLIAVFMQLLSTAYASRRYYDMRINFSPIFFMVIAAIGSYYLASLSFIFETMLLSLAFKAFIFALSALLLFRIMWYFSEDKQYFIQSLERIYKYIKPS